MRLNGSRELRPAARRPHNRLAAGKGSRPVTVVPLPGADLTSRSPPSAASLSAMFRRPDPIGVWRES
jgi:hypothetical protein